MILGDDLEQNFRRSLVADDGNYLTFLDGPLNIGFAIAVVIVLFLPQILDRILGGRIKEEFATPAPRFERVCWCGQRRCDPATWTSSCIIRRHGAATTVADLACASPVELAMSRLARFAYDPTDTAEMRVEKVAALIVAGASCGAGLVWAAMYAAVFGWGLTAALPLIFALIVGVSLVVAHRTRDHRYAVYAQIVCIIYITAFIQWSIGGVFDSGFVLAWAFIGPITALVFFSLRQSVVWFGLYVVNVVITVVFDDAFSSNAQDVSEGAQLVFVAMNLGISSLLVFVFAGYFVSEAVGQRERANQLLLNVLPKEIAPILKESSETIADSYESASVLFADIVDSTPIFAGLDPTETVDWLNEVFSMFDALVERYGLEKIRTMGDSYMVASGVPVPRKDHAGALAMLALDMIGGLERIPPRAGRRLEFRIGINSGPLVAGVIGTKRFHYDVWGDTVNTASRMESHGMAGRAQITRETYELLGPEFGCEPRGSIDIKGKGAMETWFLVSGPK